MSLLSPSTKTSSGLFVPVRFGYREIADPISKESTNKITEFLGYHIDQVSTYLGDFKQEYNIDTVVFELFTTKIVFVRTEESVVNLKKSKVDFFLRNFSVKNQYDSYNVREALQAGVDNQSLDITFLARVLNIKNPALNGVFNVERLGLNLYFENGLLTDFDTATGLGTWAKYFQELNPRLISDYEKQAQKYWGNKLGKVIGEVNVQAEAWSKVPKSINNEFIPLHQTEDGLTDFYMLLACHYDLVMSQGQFLQMNHGRYQELSNPDSSNKMYRLRNFVYEFDGEGKLLKISNYE
jgi:hypothetical protein